VIKVSDLRKEFLVSKKEPGIKGALKNIIRPKKELVKAVNGISFEIGPGEVVGYIGPNGSGKSTTVKMMSGILTPTSGTVEINGLDPQKDRKKVVKNLGVVFGQRTQLYWDLRLGESFELLKRIYQIEDSQYKKNLALMDDILNIGEIINTPVRQLSLGQRMRGDLTAAVLHSPQILFLDEPTIGLDVDGKYSIRKFIRDINQSSNTTIILTTHDLMDIQELCKRVIIINKGVIVEDGSLDSIIKKIAPVRRLIVDFYNIPHDIHHERAKVVYQNGERVCFEFDKESVPVHELIADISSMYPIKDLTLEEANIEDIIRQIYNESKSCGLYNLQSGALKITESIEG